MELRKRIISVSVVRMVDDNPDLSWIGEYTSELQGEHCIDREKRGDMERGEYRYFVPTISPEQSGNPASAEADYQRMERYNAGDWCMLGIKAVAEVVMTGSVVQRVSSGGLWGVESDSEESYLQEVGDEELGTLREELESMGFTTRQINAAFKQVTHVER